MPQPLNRYKADLREIKFVLFEQLKLGELLEGRYGDWDEETTSTVIDEVYRFACEVSGPYSAVGDHEGCRLENGDVKTPTGFKAAWEKLYAAGWKSLSVPDEFGGQGAPRVIAAAVEEFLSGSNTAWNMYPGLTVGAAEVIAHFGTDRQKKLFAGRMFAGEYAGTMCLSEPHAGSDVGAAYHSSQIDLLTPLVKAYSSDQAFRVCETAIQVFGGSGYTRDYPVEQYARDSKVFSIYEGTNHIQSLDLVARKLGQNGGAGTQAFFGDIAKFCGAHEKHPVLGAAVAELSAAQEAVAGTAMHFLMWFQSGQMQRVPLVANRFLEMMSELAIGWLLLEGASIACEQSEKLGPDHADANFYAGKKAAAIFFARNVLPNVVNGARIINAGDTSPIDIPDAAFAQL